MEIVVLILQMLGWILLAIALVLLVSVLMVLFTPFRYRVEGHAMDDIWVRAKAHWLWRLLRGRLSFGNNLLYGEVYLLWRKISFTKDFNEVEETVDEAEKEADSAAKKTKDQVTDRSEESSMISKIKGTIKTIREAIPKIKKIWKDEKNRKAVAHLKDEALYLVKILSPRKGKIQGVYSTGSPDTTGQLLGFMSWMPIFYKDCCKIYPDFESEELYFKGDFWCRGKVYGFQILGILVRILMDKNCQRMYAMLEAFKKSLNRKNIQEEK